MTRRPPAQRGFAVLLFSYCLEVFDTLQEAEQLADSLRDTTPAGVKVVQLGGHADAPAPAAGSGLTIED
ncbi:hypothetical protein [Silvimonas iriomotensis]|uniref:Uncharacterized protein n=1 Tax=Silvimonas iriomotensis TaxID=449662 RepID=A0ABQ2P5X1_9NEIS|nr:hypothetical protein [Silvimonas iriomotensis]GGP18818.1 hypothetical protein GCM10010970_07530 [Silvimonas iriomotensis]